MPPGTWWRYQVSSYSRGTPFPLRDPTEMLLDWLKEFFVHHGFVTQSFQVTYDIEYRRLGGAIGQWRHRRVNDPDALFDCL
jgi:hypothetical protein